MSKRAILFANGELTDADTIHSLIQADDVLICADGGTRHALALGLKPDLVIGDLDSISPEDLDALQQLGCQIEQHPVDKDATDLELALLAAQRLGVEEVVLVAALGGRLDQSLGNLMLMASPSFTNLRLSLVDGRQTASIVRDQITITGNVGDTVSALALSPVVEGLTYHHGLRWPLQDFTLPFGSTRGISNELIAEQAHISLRNGILLVIHTTSPDHAEITDSLRLAYDNSAMQRDSAEIEPWKIVERDRFLSLCLQEGRKTLLEIGAGPGHTSRYFQDNGLEVVCIDLSPSMVALCRKKGLTAYTMDVLALDFPPGSFDAVFALNSLLHIPKRHLPQALDNISSVLKPDGLFYLGVYGGYDSERIWEDDPLEPKRFFSFHTDEQIQQTASDAFDILQFKRIPFRESDTPIHFQSLVLRRRQIRSQLPHQRFMQKAIDLALEARKKGNHPFGALLVLDEEVQLTAENKVNTDHDVTNHAELNLVSLATRQFPPEALAKMILYTSTEPCAMCAGAIYWAGIRTVVYGCSAELLGEIAGDSFVVPCRELFARGREETIVVGPVMEETAVKVHHGFWDDDQA